MAGEYYDSPVNKYLNTYTTFSGADIVATFGGKQYKITTIFINEEVAK